MPPFTALVGFKLSDIEIDVTLQKFIEIVWEKGDYLSKFLTDELLEKDVAITEWKSVRSSGADCVKFERAISSQHPLPISLPWLPLYIQSSNVQSLEYDRQRRLLRIVEMSTIKGLPFINPYVITEWDVNELPTGSCYAHVSLRFEYEKASWLQSMVESHSRTELLRFFAMWKVNFALQLTALKERKEIDQPPRLHSLSTLFQRTDLNTEQLVGATAELSGVIVSSDPSSDTSNKTSNTQSNMIEGGMNSQARIILKSPVYRHQHLERKPSMEAFSSGYNAEETFDSSCDESLKWADSPPIGDFTDRNILIETIAALIINYFCGIKVAALHGIEVNNSFRFVQPPYYPVNFILFLASSINIVIISAGNDGHSDFFLQMGTRSNCFNIVDILLHLDL